MEGSGPIGYGNYSDEATLNHLGTSLLEATRPATVIVAAQANDEEVVLEPYANGFWHGMRLTLDDWKPFISSHDVGMPLTAILGHCTTMINEEDRAAVLTPMAKAALPNSWQVVPELVEMLHVTLAGSRNIEIR
jgi:uncharacterized protein